MGIFEKIFGTKEEREKKKEEKRRKAKEAWEHGTPIVVPKTIDGIKCAAFDFENVPTVINNTKSAERGTMYLFGRNYETVIGQFRNIAKQIEKKNKTAFDVFEKAIDAVIPFEFPSESVENMLGMHLPFDVEGYRNENGKVDLSGFFSDDEFLEIYGKVNIEYEVEIDAFFNRKGKILYCEFRSYLDYGYISIDVNKKDRGFDIDIDVDIDDPYNEITEAKKERASADIEVPCGFDIESVPLVDGSVDEFYLDGANYLKALEGLNTADAFEDEARSRGIKFPQVAQAMRERFHEYWDGKTCKDVPVAFFESTKNRGDAIRVIFDASILSFGSTKRVSIWWGPEGNIIEIKTEFREKLGSPLWKLEAKYSKKDKETSLKYISKDGIEMYDEKRMNRQKAKEQEETK